MAEPPFAARALLFDLDGTLIDTVPDIAAAANQAMRIMGRPERPIKNLRRWIGNGSRKFLQRTLTGEWNGEPEEALLEEALAHFFDQYAEHVWEQSRLYPGVEDTLSAFHEEGFAMACVTNKPGRHTALLLEASGLSCYLSRWIGGDTIDVRKPDPGPLIQAASDLGCAPAESVMIGDSVNDILAGQAAGMPVLCLTYGYNQGLDLAASGPDRLVDHFFDLPRHVSLAPGR